MITNSNGNGVVMIEYLVFVALHAAKASSTDILLNERLFFYLHVMWVDISPGNQVCQPCVKLLWHQRHFQIR